MGPEGILEFLTNLVLKGVFWHVKFPLSIVNQHLALSVCSLIELKGLLALVEECYIKVLCINPHNLKLHEHILIVMFPQLEQHTTMSILYD